MTERDALINAILDYVVVGNSIIVECHTGPNKEGAFVTDLRFLNYYSQIEANITDDTEKCKILTFDL